LKHTTTLTTKMALIHPPTLQRSPRTRPRSHKTEFLLTFGILYPKMYNVKEIFSCIVSLGDLRKFLHGCVVLQSKHNVVNTAVEAQLAEHVLLAGLDQKHFARPKPRANLRAHFI
jgi:hypothetical protein